jgi:hypothetical protein
MDLAPSTLSKGKLGMLPHKIKDRDQVKKIFKKSGEVKK